MNQVREAIRLKHYSLSTEKSYCYYVLNFIRFHDCKHPADMGAGEVKGYLTHLAVHKRVAASTQNVALAALLFLYETVLSQPLGQLAHVVRAKRSSYIPTVLSQCEVRSVLAYGSGSNALVLKLLYGTGMRLMEALRLRIKDIDFEYRSITIHDAKGKKGRVTMLPQTLIEPLQAQLRHSRLLYDKDLASGAVRVALPADRKSVV